MISRLRALKRRVFGPHLPVFPVEARQIEYSAILSMDDEPAHPSDRLLDLALGAAEHARTISMAAVTQRMKAPPYYPEVWPGEHYKLLAGLVLQQKPQLVIEIGTAAGLSALAIRPYLPEGSRLVTFDIVPWEQFPGVCLNANDFADGVLRQVLGDVAETEVMRRHADLFRTADLIFVDGPKDGKFERVFLDRLAEINMSQRPVIVFDDIRLWQMLAIWRGIRRPKLDITSFGHWSGTGLVDWTS